ncbi:MAG: hypothetical protein K6G66_10690 [Oscillospiraceae bacterium]|nr:hypothetical protein [Oscillospiraceae bacterium]
MTITEKTAYLKGLADGLGVDPQSKEGKLWSALNDLLCDIAHELENLHETDRGQAQALDGLADEVSLLEDICDGMDERDYEKTDDEDDEDLSYDGVVYDATCPVCGEEISFDEDTLETGSIQCPKCGETLEFDLGAEEEEKPADKEDELKF